ncbi:DNA-binding transcriptional LysR family regulator [Devosia subaequoris]|uniref:DNA-binding transcriptional LysR family regulator n=2 Tax=Devosia subaequoris TaxID=395930 RepID=A0A7W6ILV6_9HYPH|nr:LysR family transcriptional regulator [Devosia subaequoris]MBB4051340.1 DNA-binding transcriptional LysR family regulator [Devosia subaequoris]MCP1208937.1 LysR family transcriptional regulator [Devosia subaequoris]
MNDGISVIGAMNWAAVDLNLLRVFDAMMLELNTTRAGDRVGLSQPAVSSALGRLRHITGDVLFVREGNRMVPTARAEQLAEPIRAALRGIEEALGRIASFEPATARRAFRILGSDYFSTLLMPGLARAVRESAPGITIQMLDYPSSAVARLLSDGAVDVAVDSKSEMPDWVASHRLFRSRMVSIVRRDHPVVAHSGLRPGERIPEDLFCMLPHVLMSMDGSLTGTVDHALKQQGLSRAIAVTVPHFHAVALAVAEAGLIGNLPIHFAERVAPLLDLDIYELPFPPPPVDVMLYWHSRHGPDAAHAWLRDMIGQTLCFPL